MFLTKPGAEAEHELDALEFVEPVLECGREFIGGGRGNADGAGGAELGAGEGAIAAEGAVAVGGAELEVFGEEEDDGDAVAGVDVELIGEVAVLVAVEEAEVDQIFFLLGDTLEERALLDAVAAPDAAENQDFHLAGEAGGHLKLSGR